MLDRRLDQSAVPDSLVLSFLGLTQAHHILHAVFAMLNQYGDG